MNRCGLLLVSWGLLAAIAACGQDQSTNDKYVSKEDYLKLKSEHDQLKQELEVVHRQLQELLNRAAPVTSNDAEALKVQIQALEKKNATQQSESDQAIDDLEKQLREVKQVAKESFPGSTKMLIGGYGSATFTSTTSGYGPATPLPPDSREARNFFTATFNPIFLWKMTDRLFFEGELELELENTDTTLSLEMAQISYLLNDYMTIGVGKFLNPMDYFVERQHMAWVNKLPSKPLAVYDGLLPESMLGLQLRGGIPIGPTKLGYAFFVANAPSLVTTASNPNNPLEVGTLEFDNFDNSNNHVAVGGRIGFYPLPELEVGYGFMVADVGPAGTPVSGLFQSADLSYVREIVPLKGTLNVHAQWVWSDLDHATFDVGNGPFTFSNNRDGGYAQIAYRPTRLENTLLKNLEPVVRYDVFNQSHTPVGFDEHRWTFGLDYWIAPSTVAKIAYELDRQNGTGHNGDAFMVQFAVGF